MGGEVPCAGVPIVGDDIKSQVGATITHRVLAKLFEDRGVQLDRTMQLNVGGNMDFLNMKELERLESKKVSKTQSVTSQVDRDMGKDNVHIGPSDYVAWLDDRKWAYVRLEGRAFGDVPLNLEYKLEVWDSPNSAGIIIDAVRAAKIALDRGIGGPILSASSYFMKSPPEQYGDDVARDAVEQFIRGASVRTDARPLHTGGPVRSSGQGLLSLRRHDPTGSPGSAGKWFRTGNVSDPSVPQSLSPVGPNNGTITHSRVTGHTPVPGFASVTPSNYVVGGIPLIGFLSVTTIT